MLYVSTRGGGEPRHFSDILLEGLAPDGGLFLPQRYPRADLPGWRAAWRDGGYPELAAAVLSEFIDDIPADDLTRLCHDTYTEQTYRDPRIAPLNPLGEQMYLLGLSNGPTLAFKDMAMQLLGALFEYELGRRNSHLNILGATSGDTGSAAEYAMRGRTGVQVFMLSPHGRMSAFQQAQMFSLDDPNIHNIAIRGVFDDCQDLVKGISADLRFKRAHHIGTVNSINWARVVAQVVYYVAGWVQATETDDQQVTFAVPTGNFGNILAGHIAKQMGLPVKRLILATNENNVLDEFFRTGTYRPRPAKETHATSSPSMDISRASNFERFVADLLGRDADALRKLFDEVRTHGSFAVDADQLARCREEFGFVSGSSTHADRLATIKRIDAEHGRVIDPHTADAVHVADQHAGDEPVIVLETALPVKFAETIREAIGRDPEMPEDYRGLEDLPRHVDVLDNDLEALRDYITSRV
ncbi:threonine synthase [Enemella sp. A6]|uniref:threonine synthase n=1 Tax=Enemella sp. A6 TaxID=3440152 RepID=UPI003EBC73B4